MKQSVYSKEYSATGKNGTFTAEVTVVMNYSSKILPGHNPSTHEDTSLSSPVHKVEVCVDGKFWKKVEQIESEAKVLEETEKLRNETLAHLEELAKCDPVVSFTDKINEILS